MKIKGLSAEKFNTLCDRVLVNWSGDVEKYFDRESRLFDVVINVCVPITLKYFAGDDANSPYISIWCGDKVLSLTHSDYISIEL